MSVLAVATRSTDGATDDHDLVAAVRAGDDRAFELLFARYQRRITAYVRGRVGDHGRAEDITQEVFMAALRRMREETDREIHFRPWIYEIAKNKCIDAFRRTCNISEVSFDARDAVGDDDYGRLAEPFASPDSAVEGKVAIDNLCGAFGGLSQTYHDILVLREFEGLSYREIGDRMGMSRPAVESTLHRARKRLTEEYEEIVSGESCLRVQRLVDDHGGRPSRMRDRHRMDRHLSHCQPCRRYACRAGIELAAPASSRRARIAAFLPLPAFLRRRGAAGEETVVSPLVGHGGSLSQWSANVVTMLDPGVASGWAKAVATAATVAIAGIGAGAAVDDRTPFAAFGGQETPGWVQGIFGANDSSATAPPEHGGAVKPGATGATTARGPAPTTGSSADPARPGSAPAAKPSRRTQSSPASTPSAPAGGPNAIPAPDRALDSVGSVAPSTGVAPDTAGDGAAPRPREAAERVIGTVSGVRGDQDAAGTDATVSSGSDTPALRDRVGDALPTQPAIPVDEPEAASSATPDVPAPTGLRDSVPSTVSENPAAPTMTLKSLGG